MLQFIRKVDLIVSGASGGLNLSRLRISFEVKKDDAQSPNQAQIKIFNLSDDTAKQIKKEFTRVILQAGYNENFGVIFDGTIKQVKTGREVGTDTYLIIEAADGDAAYNFAVVNTSIAAGATQDNQIAEINKAMGGKGAAAGYNGASKTEKLPRGKVMYGMARDYARATAQTTDTAWSIQDGKVQFVPIRGVLPSQAIKLNSKSGLIDTPEQSNDGIKIKCLLNPMLKIGGRVIVNQEDIALAKLTSDKKEGEGENKPAKIADDGAYKILKVDIKGDTHGNDWYSELVAIDIDESAPAKKKTKAN